MSRFRKAGLASAVLLAAIAASATAWAAGGKPHDPKATAALGAIPAAASVPTNAARVTALIQRGGTLIRGKNVASVSHPTTGTYCVRPSSTAHIANTANVTPSATVEWGLSSGANGEMVQYLAANNPACPAGTIEFLTFEQDLSTTNGPFIFSDDVAFVVVVP